MVNVYKHIFIHHQKHVRALKFIFYRLLVSALVSSHHQALSKNKCTHNFKTAAKLSHARMWLCVFAVFKGFSYFYSWIRPDDDAKPEMKIAACKIKL